MRRDSRFAGKNPIKFNSKSSALNSPEFLMVSQIPRHRASNRSLVFSAFAMVSSFPPISMYQKFSYGLYKSTPRLLSFSTETFSAHSGAKKSTFFPVLRACIKQLFPIVLRSATSREIMLSLYSSFPSLPHIK